MVVLNKYKKIQENLNIIGSSEKIREVVELIMSIAPTNISVLITGESGTGKELIARAIHEKSARHVKPMVTINCGAIPGELLESELFGHEKGAFTGAHRTRIGRFEIADGSTVFLDEVGDMDPNLQVKLLRVLQEQVFERVGNTKPIKVDIRILAATNKDLKESIKNGTFREDLFYRLNVIPIRIAPLRKRKSDIPMLVRYFQQRLSERHGLDMNHFSDRAMDMLVQYEWPGNIRELENLMERLFVLVENDTIDVTDLPENIFHQAPCTRKEAKGTFESGIGFNEAVEKFQRDLILQALNQTHWIKAKSAELFKMNRTTLVEKIKKMKIGDEEHIGDVPDI